MSLHSSWPIRSLLFGHSGTPSHRFLSQSRKHHPRLKNTYNVGVFEGTTDHFGSISVIPSELIQEWPDILLDATNLFQNVFLHRNAEVISILNFWNQKLNPETNLNVKNILLWGRFLRVLLIRALLSHTVL